MDMEIVTQFSVFIPQKAGALSKFIKILMNNDINVIGIASDVGHDLGVVRIAVEHRPKISHILTKQGFTSVEMPMLSIVLPDKKGQLHRLTSYLAKNKVNIKTVYGTAFGGYQSRLLFTVDNMDKAKKLLKKYNGVK